MRHAKYTRFSRTIKYRYDITVAEYAWKLHEQGFQCALCPATDVHIDHCHRTGKFRGLLCANCNSAIGKFNDDVERLARAITYLA